MSKDNKSKTIKTSGKKQHKNIGLMIGSILILMLTIIAFIFVPAMSQSGSSSEAMVFGSYGDTKIEYVDGNYFQRQIEYINNVYRDSDTLSDNVEYKRQMVWQTAFNQTVIQKAIEENLSKSGVQISDSQIDKAMVERGAFNEDGVFNEARYKKASSSYKYNLRNQYNEDLLREQYLSDVTYGTKRSKGLIEFITEMGSEEKSFNYVIFNSENIENEYLASYASSNLNLFSKASLNKITIFSSEEDAVKLQTKISADEISFKEAAIAESKDSYAAEGGNAGELYFYEISSDIESEETAKLVFALKDKDISDVITTSYGWVIYQMVNSPIMPDLISEDTIHDIKMYMSRNEKGLLEDYLVSKGIEFSNKITDSDFISTAIAMNVENGTTDYFAINYGNNRMIPSSITSATDQNASFSSAAFDELFMERLFSLKNDGDISNPLVIGNNVVIAQLVGSKLSDKIPEASMEYYQYQVESEISGYMQTDLQNYVLASDEFNNNFIQTYANLFYSN